MTAKRIVILGNGGAAIHAVRAARSSGFSGEIHMVSDTDGSVFNPMLSPYYLKGNIQWDMCFPFDRSVYSEYDVTCHFGFPTELLDPVNQEVTIANKEKLGYDKCLIATGASPVIPPIPGLRGSNRACSLRNARSVNQLERAVLSAKKIIVLGASLVGLKLAEVLAKRSIQVILLDVADQMLPQGAHVTSASYLRKYFEEHGVDVRLGCTLTGMEDRGEGVTCHFPDDIFEEADCVAVCTGVRPNVDFIESGSVEMKQAILVDERLRTNCENLYAAGDVSQGYNVVSGRQEWLGTWGNACAQGYIAGCNMAGKGTKYPGSISQNISPFFDWTYAQLGYVRSSEQHARYVTFGEPSRGGYVLLMFEGNKLRGANLINCTHLAGKLRKATIQNRDWSKYLADPDKYSTTSSIEKFLDEHEQTAFLPFGSFH